METLISSFRRRYQKRGGSSTYFWTFALARGGLGNGAPDPLLLSSYSRSQKTVGKRPSAQRNIENQHKSCNIHVPTFRSLL